MTLSASATTRRRNKRPFVDQEEQLTCKMDESPYCSGEDCDLPALYELTARGEDAELYCYPCAMELSVHLGDSESLEMFRDTWQVSRVL